MAGQELEDPRPAGPSIARERDPYLSSFSLSSLSKGPGLRIGLLLRGSHLTRASISVIDDIEASNFARIEMILLSPAPAQGRRTGTNPFVRPLRSMSDALSRAVWQVYLGLDRRRVRLLDDPLSVLDASSRLRGIPMVRVSPTEGDGEWHDRPRGCLHPGRGARRHHPPGQRERDGRRSAPRARARSHHFRAGRVRHVGVSLRRSRIRAKRAGVSRGDRLGETGLLRLPGATPRFSNWRAHARHSCVSDGRRVSYPQPRTATLRIDPSRDPEASRVARRWLGASCSSRSCLASGTRFASAPTPSKRAQACALDGPSAGAEGGTSARDDHHEARAGLAMADSAPGGLPAVGPNSAWATWPGFAGSKRRPAARMRIRF